MTKSKFYFGFIISNIKFKASFQSMLLRSAVKAGNTKAVRELLEQGVDPNYTPWVGNKKIILELAQKKKNLEIIKLLIHHGVSYENPHLINYIFFEQPDEKYAEDFIFHVVNNYNKDCKIFRHVFCHLFELESLKALEILKRFLNNGVPINDYVFWGHTPLHRSIARQRIDFVLLLIGQGADIHKKTKTGASPLHLAVSTGNLAITELLLKNGAFVDERNKDRRTALHNACALNGKRKSLDNIIRTLLEYGANFNLLDANGKTPVMVAAQWPKTIDIMIKELTKSVFKNHFVSEKNFKYLRENRKLQGIFQECLIELDKMVNLKFYDGLSLYDVLDTQKGGEKLILLSNSEIFSDALKSSINHESIKYFAADLFRSFKIVQERRKFLKFKEKELILIFKNQLPDLVIQKIAYFSMLNSV